MLITDAAVREAAATLAESLGGDWTLDPEAPADGAAHLIYSDGRAISFRPIFGGATVQLWITGNAAPTLPDDATPAELAAHEAHIAARLPEGHRYNKATTLITDEEEDPAVIILRTLEDHLLPAFEYKPRYVGHRPWIDLFDNALAAVTAERGAPPAAADEAQPEATVEPAPAPEPGAEAVAEPEPEAVADPEPEPEAVADPDAEVEREPEAESEVGPPTGRSPQSQGPAGEGHSDHASTPVDESQREDDPTGGDAQPEAAPNRRPRKRTPKRRPRASTN
ncbi:hypothetical protein SAMN05428942_2111 [Streptomyces sp. 2112.2]|uniref:hypothetical protein n=1 Tax=Streptomyces sp. 2112.2 TaxID=1881024 RepID=UPI0008953A65|nr:hypothetical protein [Streptomyces sp. 2112.2]SED60182.1 hypothetical protein SAMN05428942_2111 [Streptomyces sp. 2112.2]